MKPNGRRAWRKWAKKRLDIVDGFVSSAWLDVRYWDKWRRHRKSLNPQRTIGLLPPKPFTARCLVGMSEGAKKRLRRTTSKLLDRMHSNLASLGHQHDADRNDSFLRIGERLRPCPGCFHCQPGVKGWHLDRSRSGRFNMPTLALHCDGSGVIPARKQG